jgi:hypothetical protein
MNVKCKDIAFVFNGPSLETLEGDEYFKKIVHNCVLVGANNCYPAFSLLRSLGTKFDYISMYCYWDVIGVRPVLSEEKMDAIVGSGAKIICPILSHRNNDMPESVRGKYKDVLVELEPDVNRDKQYLSESTLVKMIAFFQHCGAKRIFLFGCDGHGTSHYRDNDFTSMGVKESESGWTNDRKRINKEWGNISKEFNITIPVFNVTSGSKLDVFPKIDTRQCLEMVRYAKS